MRSAWRRPTPMRQPFTDSGAKPAELRALLAEPVSCDSSPGEAAPAGLARAARTRVRTMRPPASRAGARNRPDMGELSAVDRLGGLTVLDSSGEPSEPPDTAR